jgi:hypothetical protein
MKWASLLVCALGVSFFGVSGCDTSKLFVSAEGTLSADALGSMRIMAGPPSTVAVTCQGILQARGFQAKISGAGDDMVVESTTAGGLHFALQLHRVVNSGSDWTRINLVWMDSNKDSKTHVQIMTEFDKTPGVKKYDDPNKR